MKWGLHQWFVVCLFGGMIVVGPACFAEEPGESIKEKVLKQWERYARKTEAFRCECLITSTYDTVNGPESAKFRVSFVARGPKHRFTQFPSNENKTRLMGQNEEYIFELIGAQGEAGKWLLKDVPARLDDQESLQYSEHVLYGIQVEMNYLVPSIGEHFTGGDHDLAYFVKHQTDLELTLIEEMENGDLKAKMVFREELDDLHSFYSISRTRKFHVREMKGEIILIRDSYYLPRKYHFELRGWETQQEVGTLVGTIEKTFEYSKGALPHLIRTEVNTTFVEEGQQEYKRHDIVEIEKWELAPELTKADFRLPAFGLPEPPFVKPKRSWVVYLAVIAACLGLIGGTVWLKRRIKQ